MNFTGEHTLIGQAGHFLIISGFVFSLTTLVSYIAACRSTGLRELEWKQFSRFTYLLHSLAVAGAIALLFFMISSHYFEYHYVWKYSNLSMEAKYIFSCFWSGQEGSLMLWSFWIALLGWIVIRTSSAGYEQTVMPVIALVQAFICSMLLGVIIGDVKIGSSPFILIRELPENAAMPWARMSDYLVRITSFQDGVGLNPLLQNYWMTIHPPVLFLGFASTLIPFAFAVGSFARGNYTGWVRPALPWAVFGITVLGAGILLGGAWAYESLSFGGFWAWDPVENASLVPWLLLVAGAHCLQVSWKRGRGIYLSAIFSILPFLLVLYSSFLTRSGILGESSVHSFTENGLFLHLVFFVLASLMIATTVLLTKPHLKYIFFALTILLLVVYVATDNLSVILPIWGAGIFALLIFNYEKYFSRETAPIDGSSREFWMFAGVFILLISSVQITIATSIPLINKLFGTNLDAFTDLTGRNQFYGTWQVPVAIGICLLTGFAQFLNYRKTTRHSFFRKIRVATLASAILAAILIFVYGFNPLENTALTILVISSTVAICFNFAFLKKYVTAFWSGSAGAHISHIGFTLIILGALISGAKRSVISSSKSRFSLQELNKDFRNDENILLRQGDTVQMHNYFVTYRGRNKKGVNIAYEISYLKPRLHPSGKIVPGDSLFSLYPIVQLNEQFGNVAEPGTKSFFSHDVFTHVKYADMEIRQDEPDGKTSDGFMGETIFPLTAGEPVSMENYTFLLNEIFLVDDNKEKEKLGFREDDLIVKAELKVHNAEGKKNKDVVVTPLFIVRDSTEVIPHITYSPDLDAQIRISALSPQQNTIEIGLKQREFIVMQAYVFPAMNLLWAGCVLMVLGGMLSLRKYVARKPVLHNSMATAKPDQTVP